MSDPLKLRDEKDLGADAAAVVTAEPVATSQLPHAAPMSMDEEIAALREIAAKIERMRPDGRRAAIYWLADYYLGIRWWGWR